MKFRCVIFDLDGTLTDTTGAIARTIAAVLVAAGHPVPPHEAALATVGRPLDEAFRDLLPSPAWDNVHEHVVAYRELYDRTVVTSTELFPGVVETLAACQRAGIKLAIATTKLTSIAETVVGHCGIRDYFEVVAGGDRAPLPKPDPGLLKSVLADLDCRPSDALMVGDTVYDIQMGKAAGSETCAVTYGGVHSRDRLAKTEPDYVIDRFGELRDVLGLRTED